MWKPYQRRKTTVKIFNHYLTVQDILTAHLLQSMLRPKDCSSFCTTLHCHYYSLHTAPHACSSFNHIENQDKPIFYKEIEVSNLLEQRFSLISQLIALEKNSLSFISLLLRIKREVVFTFGMRETLNL